jgi:hypothetical protein
MDKHKEEAVHTDDRVSMEKYEFIYDIFVYAFTDALRYLLDFLKLYFVFLLLLDNVKICLYQFCWVL